MTTMYFTPRTVTEGNLTVRITKSGKWVNVDVINEYQRRIANHGYNAVEKRWTRELHLHRTKKALPDARVWECQSHSFCGSAPAF